MKAQTFGVLLPVIIFGCTDTKPDTLRGEVEVVGFAAGECYAENGDGGMPQVSNSPMFDDVPDLGEEPECVKAWRDKSGMLRLSFLDLYGNCAAQWTARANVPVAGQLNVLLHNAECKVARCTCPFDLSLEVDAPDLPNAVELHVIEENCDGVRSGTVRKLELEIGGEQRCF